MTNPKDMSVDQLRQVVEQMFNATLPKDKQGNPLSIAKIIQNIQNVENLPFVGDAVKQGVNAPFASLGLKGSPSQTVQYYSNELLQTTATALHAALQEGGSADEVSAALSQRLSGDSRFNSLVTAMSGLSQFAEEKNQPSLGQVSVATVTGSLDGWLAQNVVAPVQQQTQTATPSAPAVPPPSAKKEASAPKQPAPATPPPAEAATPPASNPVLTATSAPPSGGSGGKVTSPRPPTVPAVDSGARPPTQPATDRNTGGGSDSTSAPATPDTATDTPAPTTPEPPKSSKITEEQMEGVVAKKLHERFGALPEGVQTALGKAQNPLAFDSKGNFLSGLLGILPVIGDGVRNFVMAAVAFFSAWFGGEGFGKASEVFSAHRNTTSSDGQIKQVLGNLRGLSPNEMNFYAAEGMIAYSTASGDWFAAQRRVEQFQKNGSKHPQGGNTNAEFADLLRQRDEARDRLAQVDQQLMAQYGKNGQQLYAEFSDLKLAYIQTTAQAMVEQAKENGIDDIQSAEQYIAQFTPEEVPLVHPAFGGTQPVQQAQRAQPAPFMTMNLARAAPQDMRSGTEVSPTPIPLSPDTQQQVMR